MIAFDTHIHTYPFSVDSHQEIEAVFSANAKSPYGFVLTEHMDYLHPDSEAFLFQPEEYFRQYTKFRSNRLLLGVEMGMQLNSIEMINQTVAEYPFDMVIGSIHTADNIDVAYPMYSKTYQKIEGYQRYLLAMLECLKLHPDIDTLAHIDYICRYARYDDPELHMAEHREVLEVIFQYIIEHDICLEINTRRIGDVAGYRTLNEILRLYAYLGGKYVTVGSDAHRVENIAANFDKAEALIAEHHFIPVHFKNRERIVDASAT